MRRNFGCFKSENEKLAVAFREVHKSEASPKFNTRVSIAGDTGNTPKMKAMQGVDAALLPCTMALEMAADAVRAFQSLILYPYHFGDTDKTKLTALIEDQKAIEVRIRRMP